jgi:hypothetical protein
VVTGSLLYIPMAVLGPIRILGLLKPELGAAALAVLIGASYHW